MNLKKESSTPELIEGFISENAAEFEARGVQEAIEAARRQAWQDPLQRVSR